MSDAITSGVSELTATTTAVFTNNFPSLFGIFGILIALALVIRLIKRFVGRRA